MLESWGAPLTSLAISLIYFVACSRTLSLTRRLLASSHGVSIALLYFGALEVFWHDKADPSYTDPFLLLAIIPVVLIFVSFYAYRGPVWVPYLQILNLLSLLWTLFIGQMAVSGRWL
jgi:hypothetical protein